MRTFLTALAISAGLIVPQACADPVKPQPSVGEPSYPPCDSEFSSLPCQLPDGRDVDACAQTIIAPCIYGAPGNRYLIDLSSTTLPGTKG